MKIYLVGGAIRDKLLGLPVKEKDWVVVGATVEEMLQKGYRQVGKDFPVFLHPKTKEEYALARTERKIKRGYTGFEFDTSSHVTLEEDLQRRDLTINAMAETAEGELIDPYHGKQDLEKKLLRHVSPAFIEDPVRILRVARFAARYVNFTVAPETIELMKKMVQSGEVDALVPERVWKELERALGEKNPEQFFQVLADCDALSVLFPHLKMKSAGMHALSNAAKKGFDAPMRFAALMYNLDEAKIKEIGDKYRIPNDYRDLALMVVRGITVYKHSEKIEGIHNYANQAYSTFLSLDAFRREQRFIKFINVCELITNVPSAKFLEFYKAAKSVDVKSIVDSGLKGGELEKEISMKRIAAIQNLLF